MKSPQTSASIPPSHLNQAKFNQVKQKPQFFITSVGLLIWNFFIIACAGSSFYYIIQKYEQATLNIARTIFERELDFQELNIQLDGMYAHIGEDVEVDPVFESDPFRIISSPNGDSLTKLGFAKIAKLLNSDLGTRENLIETKTSETESKTSEVSSSRTPIINITSFDNTISTVRPDLWERSALRHIQEEKLIEFTDTYTLAGKEYMRYMAPLYVKESYLENPSFKKVFEKYNIGDIYGGISISIPLQPSSFANETVVLITALNFFLIWLVGCLFILYVGRKLRSTTLHARHAESDLKELHTKFDKKLILRTKALEESLTKAEQARSIRSNFFANISHEIKTPLNGILGMTALLLRTNLNDEQTSMAATLKTSGNRLLTVLNDVMDFSRIDSGKLELDFYTFSLRDTLYDAIKNLAPAAHGKGVEILASIAQQIPDSLLGDGVRLRQVLFHLLDNAIKFTEHGEVKLDVTYDNIKNNKITLKFSVTDTGIGIPKEKQETVLSCLEAPDESTKQEYSGIGLGLPISCKLIQLMGGEIKLTSQVGKGSVFFFELELPYLEESNLKQIEVSALELKGKNVLIVDDNATNRKILLDQVGGWGMHPIECISVDSALQALHSAVQENKTIHVIITDLQMPEKDGIDLALAVQQHDKLSSIPVILLSSGNLPSKLEPGLFSAKLSKPTRSSDLLRSLVSAVGNSERITAKTIQERLEKEQTATAEKSYNIMLVEDLEINQQVISRMLQEIGHEVTLAKHGQEALDLLEYEDIDIVLMDIQMPVMNGLEALANIRKREMQKGKIKHLPVIAVTANVLQSEKERYIAAGMDGYISKPATILEFAELIAMIGKNFKIEERQRENQPLKKSAIVNSLQNIHSDAKMPSSSDTVTEQIEKNTEKNAFTIATTDEPKPMLNNYDASSVQGRPPNGYGAPTVQGNAPSNYGAPSMQGNALSGYGAPSVQGNAPSNYGAPSVQGNAPSSYGAPSVQGNAPSNYGAPSVQGNAPSIVGNTNLNGRAVNEPTISNLTSSSMSVSDTMTTQGLTKPASQSSKKSTNGSERKVLPPLDAEIIQASFAGYADLALKSMQVFLLDAPGMLTEIKNAIAQNDNATLVVNAHAFKGLSSYYTKGDIYKTAYALEQMGREEALPEKRTEADQASEKLDVLFNDMVQAMQIYLAK